MKDWYKRLKKTRLDKGKSLKEAAINARLTQQGLIDYENGKISPKLEYIVRLCDFYGVSLNYIVYGNDNSLRLENNLQKNIEVFASLYLRCKITYNKINSTIKVNDKDLKRYIDFLIDFLNEHSNNDISTLEHIVYYIKSIKN